MIFSEASWPVPAGVATTRALSIRTFGVARTPQFFHDGLNELLGVRQFLRDHVDVQGGLRGITRAVTIDAVLADEDKSVGQPVERNGQAAACAAEHLLVAFQVVVQFSGGGPNEKERRVPFQRSDPSNSARASKSATAERRHGSPRGRAPIR